MGREGWSGEGALNSQIENAEEGMGRHGWRGEGRLKSQIENPSEGRN